MQIKLCDIRKDEHIYFENKSLKDDFLHIAYLEDWPGYKNGDIVAAINYDNSFIIYDGFEEFIDLNKTKDLLVLKYTKFSKALAILTKNKI